MFKLIALSTLLAIAAARPSLVGTEVVAPYAQLATPLAYSGQLDPIGYAGIAASAHIAAPVALPDPLIIPGSIAYAAPVAPVAITPHVAASAPVIEPVAPAAAAVAPLLKTVDSVGAAPVVAVGPIEQHGYKIVY